RRACDPAFAPRSIHHWAAPGAARARARAVAAIHAGTAGGTAVGHDSHPARHCHGAHCATRDPHQHRSHRGARPRAAGEAAPASPARRSRAAEPARLPAQEAVAVSSPLAIGAVSAVLRNLLDDAMITSVAPALGTTVTVTAVAPDTIDLDDEQMAPRLNLFLHQVTPNAGWRNGALPSRSGAGERLANAPLALDLHYLLTAYGRADFQAEILLGYAMHVLHERPWLDRASIRNAL